MILKTKKEAQKEGNKMLKLLTNPKGWKVYAWENCGWHVCLRKGGLTLYPFDDGTFQALLDDTGESISGSSFWTENYSNKNPNKVIARQLKISKAFIAHCQKTIDAIEN